MGEESRCQSSSAKSSGTHSPSFQVKEANRSRLRLTGETPPDPQTHRPKSEVIEFASTPAEAYFSFISC